MNIELISTTVKGLGNEHRHDCRLYCTHLCSGHPTRDSNHSKIIIKTTPFEDCVSRAVSRTAGNFQQCYDNVEDDA